MEINRKDILKICEIAWKAGRKILEIYSKKYTIYKKKDKSPVTIADLESEKIIINGLKKIYKNPIIFSEETNYKTKKNMSDFWLVDPLDGTKEFIKKNGEFTVNIAFIQNKKPLFGLIYAPVLNKTYVGIKKSTYKVFKKKKLKKISLKKSINKALIVSRSHSDKGKNKILMKKFNLDKVLFLGSSLKFCYLAEGIAQIYPRQGTTYEWDTAAGHAILNGVSGEIKTEDGKNLEYGKKDFKNKNFIAKLF